MTRWFHPFLVLFMACVLTTSALAQGWKSLDSTFPKTLSLVFTSNDTGYAAWENILKTTDGGHHFTALSLPSGISLPSLRSMSWPTANVGYAGGELQNATTGDYHGLLLKTTDAGATWKRLAIDSNYVIWQIDFPSPSFGYALESTVTSTGNRVIKTDDGGATWTVAIPDSPNSIPALRFRTETEGFVARTVAKEPIEIEVDYTNDGLATMTNRVKGMNPPAPSSVYAFEPSDDGAWLASADGYLYRTTDLGMQWKKIPIANEPFLQAIALKRNIGFEFSSASSPIMNMTTDYGQTWDYTILPDSGGVVKAVSIPSTRNAYAIVRILSPGTGYQLIKWSSPQAVRSEAPLSSLRVTYSNDAVVIELSPAHLPQSLEIYDLLGRTEATIEISAEAPSVTIQRNRIRAGFYIARIGSRSVKFVVTR